MKDDLCKWQNRECVDPCEFKTAEIAKQKDTIGKQKARIAKLKATIDDLKETQCIPAAEGRREDFSSSTESPTERYERYKECCGEVCSKGSSCMARGKWPYDLYCYDTGTLD